MARGKQFGYTRCLCGHNWVPFFFSVLHAPRTPSDWLGGSVRGLLLLSYTHTYTHSGFMGRVLVDFVYVVCCAVLLLYRVLRPAVVRGGTVVNCPRSPDRPLARRLSLARCRSPAVRSFAAALVVNIVTYHYYYTRGVYTCILYCTSLNRNAFTPSSAQVQQ